MRWPKRIGRRQALRWMATSACALAVGCDDVVNVKPENDPLAGLKADGVLPKVLHYGVTPSAGANTIDKLTPLLRYLERELGIGVVGTTAPDYGTLAELIKKGEVHVGQFTPAAYVATRKGLPGVALAVVVRYTIREPPRGHSEVGPVDTETDSLGDVARFLLGMRSFKYFAIGTGLAAFSAYGFGSWVPAFLGRVHGMGSGEMGTWLGIENGVGGALGAILGGLLADRLGRKDPRWYLWIGAIGMLIYLPFVVLFLLLENTTWALIWYLPAITFASMYLGPVIALTHRLVKVRMRALASAILLFILNMIGMGLGPQAVGIANDLMASTLGVEAVRYSLLYSAGSKLVAIALFLMAARHLVADLEAKNSI